jgi:hypothetical protein
MSEQKYKIMRSFPSKPSKLIEEGLTLEEAKKHCNNPATRKDGEWFDYFVKEE